MSLKNERNIFMDVVENALKDGTYVWFKPFVARFLETTSMIQFCIIEILFGLNRMWNITLYYL